MCRELIPWKQTRSENNTLFVYQRGFEESWCPHDHSLKIPTSTSLLNRMGAASRFENAHELMV